VFSNHLVGARIPARRLRGCPDRRAHGAKRSGGIGIVVVAAKIANAVYHATGRRVRNLPVTPDKLL